MQPQSDTPKFPRVTGDLEDNSTQGHKGVFGKAMFRTFVQPSLDQLSWKARQFAPRQMAFNMLSATPFGQKLLDLKGNYDFIKDPNTEGYNNTDVNTNRGGPTGGSGTPYMNQELKALVETLQNGLSSMTTELKSIKRNIEVLQRTNATGTTEQTGTKTKVTELVEMFRSFFTKEKFDLKETNLSKEHEFGETKKGEQGKNWLADMMATLIKFRLAFMGGLTALRVAMTTAFARLGAGIGKVFKAIRLPSIGAITKMFGKITAFAAGLGAITSKFKLPDMPKFGKLFSGLSKIGADIGKLLGPLGKIGGGLLRVIGRFGVITTVIMAAIDGVMGFFKGWGETDGPIYKKFAAGLDGALQGIVKGILEIPKMILQALKFIGTSIVDMLGFKQLAATMRDFNLGEWWNKTIGGFVEKFDIAQTITTIGERVVDIFLGICEFIVKKLTGITVNLRDKNADPNAEGQPNLLSRVLRGTLTALVPGAAPIVAAADIANRSSAAPSSGANGGSAAAADGGARARAGVAATARTGGAGGRPALGIRNNNPGNIEFNRSNNWVGQTGRGEGGRFAAFDSPENGVRAIGRLLQTYDRQGVNTLAGIVNKWAPAADNNDVGAYIRTLQRYTGLSANQKIDLQDPRTLQAVIRGIIAQENGPSATRITDAQIQEGVRLALGGRSRADARPNAGQAPRVDNNTSTLQKTGAAVAATLLSPFIPAPITRAVINNNVNNNQNNTIVPQRPRAVSPSASPTGPRS